MKTRLYLPAVFCLLVLIPIYPLIGEVSALADNGYRVLGKEHLATDQGWNLSDTRLVPATATHPATVDFASNKWSSPTTTLPLDRLDGGTFSFHLRGRWTAEIGGDHMANAMVFFMDSDGMTLPGAKNQYFPGKPDWQDVVIENQVPKNAVTLRIDVISSHGGTLEIADYDLFFKGVDLSTEAIRGVHLPWLQIPGDKPVWPSPGTEGASATFIPNAPFSFDDPAWNALPSYPISTTTSNKTPLNGVAASFQLAWTPDAIFVRFHAHDRTLNFNEQLLYMRDCFEFFLYPTGHAPEAESGSTGKEQYTVSRSKDGKTEATTDALTRIVDDGWEAVAKIPLHTDGRGITPFNGLAMTFNAAYQDANTMGQEHWLSFSQKDQTNFSYSDPSLYVPLVFQTGQTLAYQPMELGGATIYHVDPKFPGRFNLIQSSGTLDNIVPSVEALDAKIDARSEGGHDVFSITYPDYSPQPRVGFRMSSFNVLAGETLNLELEARAAGGSAVKVPSLWFVGGNWQYIDSQTSAPGTVGAEWTKLTYTLKAPERFRENLRNVYPLFYFETSPGRTLEVRDIRVTRRLPVDFDAAISAGGLYANLWKGEKNTLHFQMATGAPIKAKIKAEVQDYFSGKTVLSQEWTLDMPTGESGLTWDVSNLPNGFFNVLLHARDEKGGFLADRELYVTKAVKSPKISAFSGLWLYNSWGMAPPANLPATTVLLHDLGIGMVQWQDHFMFNSLGKDTMWDTLQELRAFHNAGFETGFIVEPQGSHNINRLWQPDELEDFYKVVCAKVHGLVSHIAFANEPNLSMGWYPVPDAREWAIYNRGLYNVVKKYMPETIPICGAFNGVPVKFMQEAALENHDSFADGVIGVHAYGADGGQNPFKTLLEERQQIDQTYPGWDVWDTESGVVGYTYRSLLDMFTKKAPLLQACGITRSYFYDDARMVVPCGDSPILLAVEGFKNTFYLDTTPVGHVAPAEGKVEVYLFKAATGKGLAVYWNRSHDDQAFDLAGQGGGELFDVFGNSAGTLAAGPQHLLLKERFVHYARGVDLAAMMKDASFVPCFQSKQAKPANDPSYSKSVYLSMPYISKMFDRELTLKQPSEFAISVHNASATVQKIALASQGLDGVQIIFDKGASLLLPPGQNQIVTVKLQAVKELPQPQSFSLTGTLEDGKQLLPLVYTARTTPSINVDGYTRMIEMRDNSNVAADVAVSPSKVDFFFTPATIKQRLAPGASVVVPIQIAQKQTSESTYNTPVYYDLNVDSNQGTYTKPGIMTIFQASAEPDVAADFTNLPYTAIPRRPGQEKFQAEYKLGWVKDDLRITARVQDASPMQVQEGGQLKNGGDCMIVAFDANKAQPPGMFGGGYFECGFAFSNQAPTSYGWEGHYGLETATPFPEAVRHIARDAQYIYYDVTISRARIFPDRDSTNAGMSIAFVNRTANGKSEVIEIGQGIFPERNAARLGLLLRPK